MITAASMVLFAFNSTAEQVAATSTQREPEDKRLVFYRVTVQLANWHIEVKKNLLRKQANQLTISAVGKNVQEAVRPLAHVTHAFAHICQQLAFTHDLARKRL